MSTLRKNVTVMLGGLLFLVAADSAIAGYEEGLDALHKGRIALAAKEFQAGADAGEPESQVMIGTMYEKGIGEPQDYVQAMRWFRKAGDQGYAEGQFTVGMMYDFAYGVSKDEASAFLWYHKAADQGYASAQNSLGSMYERGQGVAKDDAQAVQWYRKAADQGNAEAQNNLGRMHFDGRGVDESLALGDSQALQWFLKAADKGHAGAENNLGSMYEGGRGVAQDYSQAVQWYRKAADQGYAGAQDNLSRMYRFGLGVPQDYAQAKQWCHKAAAQGYGPAQSELARQYAIGETVAANNIIAYALFNAAFVASNATDKDAANARQDVASAMSGQEIDAAEKLTSDLIKPGGFEKALAAAEKQYQSKPEPKRSSHAKHLRASNSASAASDTDCRPHSQKLRCESQCTNGDCIVTYENGCKAHVQVSPTLDPFSSQWTYPAPSC